MFQSYIDLIPSISLLSVSHFINYSLGHYEFYFVAIISTEIDFSYHIMQI